MPYASRSPSRLNLMQRRRIDQLLLPEIRPPKNTAQIAFQWEAA
jgi:hypothetical protein